MQTPGRHFIASSKEKPKHGGRINSIFALVATKSVSVSGEMRNVLKKNFTLISQQEGRQTAVRLLAPPHHDEGTSLRADHTARLVAGVHASAWGPIRARFHLDVAENDSILRRARSRPHPARLKPRPPTTTTPWPAKTMMPAIPPPPHAPDPPIRTNFGGGTVARWNFHICANLPPFRPARAWVLASGPARARPCSVAGKARTWRCIDPTPATAPPPLARPDPHEGARRLGR